MCNKATVVTDVSTCMCEWVSEWVYPGRTFTFNMAAHSNSLTLLLTYLRVTYRLIARHFSHVSLLLLNFYFFLLMYIGAHTVHRARIFPQLKWCLKKTIWKRAQTHARFLTFYDFMLINLLWKVCIQSSEVDPLRVCVRMCESGFVFVFFLSFLFCFRSVWFCFNVFFCRFILNGVDLREFCESLRRVKSLRSTCERNICGWIWRC